MPHFLLCHAERIYIFLTPSPRHVPITVSPDMSTCPHPTHPHHSSPTVHVSSLLSALCIGRFWFPKSKHSRAKPLDPRDLTSSKTRHVANTSHRSRSIPHGDRLGSLLKGGSVATLGLHRFCIVLFQKILSF